MKGFGGEKRKDGNNISINSKIFLRNSQDYRKREHWENSGMSADFQEAALSVQI